MKVRSFLAQSGLAAICSPQVAQVAHEKEVATGLKKACRLR